MGLDSPTEEEAVAIAERVRQAVSGDTEVSADSMIKVPIRVSMGVAELDSEGSFETLLKAADSALYRAKDAGRDTVSS